jgi:hypothetical protein
VDPGLSHRRALDHVLRIVAGAPCGESLVLRGSMTMLAWAGDRARPPGDLDWVVRPLAARPVDDLDPYPFVADLDPVRLWPEVAHGAGHYRIWTFEDLDTGGFKPRVPPEGLRWLEPEDLEFEVRPHSEVLDLVHDRPRMDDGLEFDPEAAQVDANWSYAYESDGGGVRVTLPWRDGDERGSVQLDFAYDEELPCPPTFAAVPRADGGPPTVVWSATRELSLAWKVRWLSADRASEGRVAGKDLYDAVLLAELDGLRLPGRLRREIRQAIPDPDGVREWAVDWDLAGDPRDWLERLARALRRVH